MWDKEYKKLIKWLKEKEKGKGLLVHFFTSKKQERYSPPDFFILNMLSKDKEIYLKGTTGHGVKVNNEPSKVPCINFYEVDEEFYKAMKNYYQNRGNFPYQYHYALIFDKRKLGNKFPLFEIKAMKKTKEITARNCHLYDNPNPKFKIVLRPFHKCKVTRLVAKNDKLIKKPFVRIPTSFLLGIMVPKEEKRIFKEILKQKGLDKVEVFVL